MNKFQAMPPYPWQDSAWSEVTSMVAQGKLSHSVLLQGSDGLNDFAVSMAQYLLCREPIDQTACGKCKDCEIFAAGSHPDYHYTGLEEKAAQIKIDQIRLLTHFVAKTAQREKRKVVVISPANAMNLNAANALLKCLEEPSGDTVLILVQESQKTLLPTIRSRCSVVKLPQPSQQTASAWLKSKGLSSPQDALRYSQNSPILAWQLNSDGKLLQRQKIYQQLDKLIQQGAKPWQLLGAWKGVALVEIVQIILSWLEDKIRGAFISNPLLAETDGYVDRKTAEGKVEGKTDAEASRKAVAKLYSCRDSVVNKKQQLLAGYNLNEQLVLDELAIELQACAHLPLKSL